jgi:hypothetical protein
MNKRSIPNQIRRSRLTIGSRSDHQSELRNRLLNELCADANEGAWTLRQYTQTLGIGLAVLLAVSFGQFRQNGAATNPLQKFDLFQEAWPNETLGSLPPSPDWTRSFVSIPLNEILEPAKTPPGQTLAIDLSERSNLPL